MTIKELANLLHEKLCRWDHTDQCDWYYEDERHDTWNQPMHRKYLAKAMRLRDVSGLVLEDIAKVVTHLGG